MRVTDVELNSPWLPMFIGTEVELVSVLWKTEWLRFIRVLILLQENIKFMVYLPDVTNCCISD
jgi:hypothetical protein